MEIFFKNLTPEEGTAEKLLHDLRTLRDDTEELFRTAGGTFAERSKAKFLKSVEQMKATCQDLKEQTTAGVRAADRTVRSNPYSAAGIALGVGIVVGMLIRRK